LTGRRPNVLFSIPDRPLAIRPSSVAAAATAAADSRDDCTAWRWAVELFAWQQRRRRATAAAVVELIMGLG
jgi:hypothetical protein